MVNGENGRQHRSGSSVACHSCSSEGCKLAKDRYPRYLLYISVYEFLQFDPKINIHNFLLAEPCAVLVSMASCGVLGVFFF